MTWNLNVSEAPTDKDLWLATKCGKVIKSHWHDKFGSGRWVGLATREQPVAWQEFVTPVHPFTETDAAISRPASLGRPEIENRSDQEAPEADASGGMQDEIAIHPATPFIVDDCGSGA